MGCLCFLVLSIAIAIFATGLWLLGDTFEILSGFFTALAISAGFIVSVLGYPWFELLYHGNSTPGSILFAISVSLLVNFVILGAIFGRFVLRNET